jgi:hypothetical protein
VSETKSPPAEETLGPHITWPRVGTIIAVALLALGVCSLGFTPVRTDHDVFWHLKTGQVIVENGWKLPDTDPFTYGSEDVVWHNHEWLAQVIMFGIERLGAGGSAAISHADDQAGLHLLVLAKTLVLLAALGVVARTLTRNGVCAILACTVALLAAMASRWTLHCRPPVITYLFLATLLLVLSRHWHIRHPWPAALATLFHFALWSNLHGGWLAGLVVIGAWIAGDALWLLVHRARREGIRAMLADRHLFAHVVMFGGAFLGVLVNPSGWHLYELAVRVMTAEDLIALIPEMQPPPFPEHWPFFLLLVTAAVALVVGIFRTGTVRPGEAIAVLFFAWQAVSHTRHVPLFVIVAALPIGRLLQAYVDWWDGKLPSRIVAGTMLVKLLLLTLFVPFALGFGPILAGGRLIWESHAPRNARWLRGIGYEPDRYQDAACDFVRLAKPPGRLWTNLNIGGFMIWRLSPESHRVFTDSRFDLHGDSRQRVEASLNGVGPGGGVPDPDWERTLADLGVNVAVLEKATPLVIAMWRSPDWAAVHEWTAPWNAWPDGTMTFIRDTGENAEAIARARRLAASLGQSPETPPQIQNEM